jgi:adenylate cyclase
MTIGFLDLVGFTTLARRVDARELAAVIDRFEETAHDVTTAGDGRVVKFIGDEVMFVTRAAGAACDIALTLVERFAGDASVTPRGALAAGDVLVRGGDYYGPVVNLAARAASLAVPSEILVTDAVVAAAPPALRFEPAGRRALRGFDEPVRLSTVERANDPA